MLGLVSEMRRAPKPGGGGGKNKPYARPDAISTGEILTDIFNKKWKMGKSIGAGGFGDIYLASDDISKPVNEKTAQYVIKIVSSREKSASEKRPC